MLMTEKKHCFHCGLDVPESVDLPIEFDGQCYPTCCVGCQAVTKSIIDSGLDNYYRQRTTEAMKNILPPQEVLDQIKLYDLPEVQSTFVEMLGEHQREAVLMLSGITCAACVWLIEQRLLRLPGMLQVDINYSTERVRVTWDNSCLLLSDILLCVQNTGYQAEPYDAQKLDTQIQQERKQSLIRLWVAGLSMMQVMMYVVPTYLYGNDIEEPFLWLLHLASMILTIPVMVFSAVPFYRGAWRDWKNKRAGMDTPVTIAIIIAFLASTYALLTHHEEGIYFDSISMFVFLLLGGRYLEQIARRKATSATERLIKLVPAFCHRLPEYPQSEIIEEAVVAQLSVGDIILVKPGEVIPVDGEILSGSGAVNEAMLTGESIPVVKIVGNKVVAGTLNTDSPLIINTKKIGVETRLSHIVRLLDKALAQKPKIVELSDRYASWFISILLLIAAMTFIGWTWYRDAHHALWVTVALLVATCPCALSLATPAALAASTGNLANQGILISRGHTLTTLPKITDIVFDKTGTLTQGRLVVEQIKVINGLDENQALAIAQVLEAHSEHPIARAILHMDSVKETIPVTNRIQRTGFGVHAVLATEQGDEVWAIGRAEFVAEIAGDIPSTLQFPHHHGTVVYLGNAKGFQAAFLLEDELKPETTELVQQLKQLNIQQHLLSGDQENAVGYLAHALRMDNYHAGASPEEKLAYVIGLQKQGKSVLMVGDGVNDAPVLAQADVSVAVATGADVAREGADVVLLNDSIGMILPLLKQSIRTQHIIRENLIWATLYNVIMVPLAMAGYVTPWLAALGMSLSSLLVLVNALRLLR